MIPTTSVGPARWIAPEPPDRSYRGVRMRKVPKRLRKNVAWMLRNEYVVLAGWCSRYRPTAGPGDFAVGLNGTFEEIWIHPAGAGDDEDQYIGPYSWEAARELAVQGRSVLALGMMANER